MPIGFWSIYSIELIKSMSPFNSENWPGFSLKFPFNLCNAGYRIFLTKVVFPLPEIPVIQTNISKGKSTLIFFKLFSLQPVKIILFIIFFLDSGTGISISPVRYFAVRDSVFTILFKFP